MLRVCNAAQMPVLVLILLGFVYFDSVRYPFVAVQPNDNTSRTNDMIFNMVSRTRGRINASGCLNIIARDKYIIFQPFVVN